MEIYWRNNIGKMYHAPVFANGDTRKQLLARSIYLLYISEYGNPWMVPGFGKYNSNNMGVTYSLIYKLPY